MSNKDDFAKSNVGNEKANVEIRKIADERGIPFDKLITKACNVGLWSRLASAYNKGKSTENILKEIREL